MTLDKAPAKIMRRWNEGLNGYEMVILAMPSYLSPTHAAFAGLYRKFRIEQSQQTICMKKNILLTQD